LNRAKTVLLTSLRGLRLVGFKSSCTAQRSRSFAQKRWGWDLNRNQTVGLTAFGRCDW